MVHNFSNVPARVEYRADGGDEEVPYLPHGVLLVDDKKQSEYFALVVILYGRKQIYVYAGDVRGRT